MKTKTLKKNKVNVVTLGCSKNIFDSEVMMAQLKANKFEVEHESKHDDAEIVIIAAHGTGGRCAFFIGQDDGSGCAIADA